MTTVTGLTAERMIAIEDASVVDGEIVAGNLILSRFDGSQINAGSVAGPQGPEGDPGPGVPVGGATGQLLAKNSGTNYDTEWVDPPADGWEVISEGAIPNNVSSYTIGSIPQTFKDLRLTLKLASVFASYLDNLRLRFAGVSSNVYDVGLLTGNNGVVAHTSNDGQSDMGPVAYFPGNSANADAFASIECLILRYRDADFKQVLSRFASATGQNGGDQKMLGMAAGLWRNAVADALTSITLLSAGGANYRLGSYYTLEGRL